MSFLRENGAFSNPPNEIWFLCYRMLSTEKLFEKTRNLQQKTHYSIATQIIFERQEEHKAIEYQNKLMRAWVNDKEIRKTTFLSILASSDEAKTKWRNRLLLCSANPAWLNRGLCGPANSSRKISDKMNAIMLAGLLSNDRVQAELDNLTQSIIKFSINTIPKTDFRDELHSTHQNLCTLINAANAPLIDIVNALIIELNDKSPTARRELAWSTLISLIGTQNDQLIKKIIPALSKFINKYLSSNNNSDRLLACLLLNDIENLPPRLFENITPLLKEVLQDKNSNVRKYACQIFGKVKNLATEPFKKLIPTLETMLNDTDPFVRIEACRALSKIKNKEILFPVLTEIINNSSSYVDNYARTYACRVLCEITTPSREQTQQIILRLNEVINDSDYGDLIEACHILGEIKNIPEDQFGQIGPSLLAEIINSTSVYDIEETNNALASLIKTQNTLSIEKIIPMLTKDLSNNDSCIRIIAWCSLAEIEMKNPTKLGFNTMIQAFKSVISNATDLGYRASEQGCKSLCKLIKSANAPLDEDLISAFKTALNHEDPYARRAACDILGEKTESDAIIPIITEKLDDKDPDVRLAACKALSKRKELTSDLFNQIAQLLIQEINDGDPRNDELGAVLVLNSLQETPNALAKTLSGNSILALRELLNNESRLVRITACHLLGKSEKLEEDLLKQIIRVLLNALSVDYPILDGSDVEEACCALDSLKNIPEASLLTIINALSSILNNHNFCNNACEAARNALISITDSSPCETVAEFLESFTLKTAAAASAHFIIKSSLIIKSSDKAVYLRLQRLKLYKEVERLNSLNNPQATEKAEALQEFADNLAMTSKTLWSTEHLKEIKNKVDQQDKTLVAILKAHRSQSGALFKALYAPRSFQIFSDFCKDISQILEQKSPQNNHNLAVS